MGKHQGCLAVFLSLLLVSSSAGFILQVNAASDEWPMFHHDAEHTGTASTAVSGNSTLWQLPIGDKVYSSCAVVNGIVYVGSNNGTLYALNAANGTVVWSYNTGGIISSSPTVVDGKIYVGTAPVGSVGSLFVLNATNGELMWQGITDSAIDTSSPVLVTPSIGIGPLVCAVTTSGKIYAWDAITQMLLWSQVSVSNFSSSSPAANNGRLYIGSNDGYFYCVDPRTGVAIFSFQTGGRVVSSPAIADGVVYFGSDDYNVYALNATTGIPLWNFTTGDMLETCPAVANGIVYICSNDHLIYALNATNGTPIWSVHEYSQYWPPTASNSSYVYSSPAFSNGILYVGSFDGLVYALNATTGATIWSYDIGNFIYASPAIAYGVLYIGSFDGNIYAIGSYSGPIPTPMPSPSPSPTQTSSSGSSSSSSSSSGSSSSSSTSSTSTPAPTDSPLPTPETGTIQATTGSGNNVTLSLGGNITSTQITNATVTTDQNSGKTTITFTINGQSGNVGVGNVTIAKSDVPYGTTPTIYIDGDKVKSQGFMQDATNYYVWYTMHFSTHEVSIVFTSTAATQNQDFPLWAIGLIVVLIVAIVGTVVFLKRQGKTAPKTTHHGG